MQYKYDSYIQERIDEKKIFLSPIEYSRNFAEFYKTLPFTKPLETRVNWDKVPEYSKINWSKIDDDEFVDWAKKLKIGEHEYIAIWYPEDKPCLIAPFEYGIAEFDALLSGAPGDGDIAFGVDKVGSEYIPRYSHFIEHPFGDYVFGIK